MADGYGTVRGRYVVVENEVTEEVAKEIVLQGLIEDIKKIAKENPDFFIIKKAEAIFPHTVGAKFYLPTVKEEKEDAGD